MVLKVIDRKSPSFYLYFNLTKFIKGAVNSSMVTFYDAHNAKKNQTNVFTVVLNRNILKVLRCCYCRLHDTCNERVTCMCCMSRPANKARIVFFSPQNRILKSDTAKNSATYEISSHVKKTCCIVHSCHWHTYICSYGRSYNEISLSLRSYYIYIYNI